MPERRRVRVGKDQRPEPPPELPLEPLQCACPRLDRDDWDDVESDWSDIAFLRTGTTAVMGVPVGYAGSRAALSKKAAGLGLAVPDDAMFLIGAGRFRRPVMLEVEETAPGQRGVVRPGGVAYSRLVSAPWGEMGRVVEETRQRARERYGRQPDALWLWYLTCRTCSQEREYETLVVAHYADVP
ncbi:MAG: hypothetical protein IT304_01365 [Dehalococcoidia bacterium]|nr:hypothetical protein [Dehalococcoidia bacterium]